MGAIDYWCNVFTEDGIDAYWRQQPEIAHVMRWWNLEHLLVGYDVPEFVARMDEAKVDAVIVPAARMASYVNDGLIWDVPEEEVASLAAQAPGRIYGLVGINPRDGMEGVRRLERWVRDVSGVFVGAHLHPYGYDLAVNHRKYYPYYAKCIELGVPVVMQVGHSAESMPSSAGRPALVDDIALDFPELVIVGAHTGWPWVEELIAAAWKHPNVYIGTSAHHPKYWDPSLVRFAKSRGRGKVLFGTDYPVLDHAGALEAIGALDLGDAVTQQLTSEVARTVFRIP